MRLRRSPSIYRFLGPFQPMLVIHRLSILSLLFIHHLIFSFLNRPSFLRFLSPSSTLPSFPTIFLMCFTVIRLLYVSRANKKRLLPSGPKWPTAREGQLYVRGLVTKVEDGDRPKKIVGSFWDKRTRPTRLFVFVFFGGGSGSFLLPKSFVTIYAHISP